MMIIDTHAHLDFEQFQDDLDEVLDRARIIGVEKIITIGCNIGSAKNAIKLAEKYEQVFAAVGIHPCDILEGEQQTKQLLQLDQIFEQSFEKSGKIVAIGEIGLDYYWMENQPDVQKEMLRLQLQMASEKKLPVILHCRNAKDGRMNAYEDVLKILLECKVERAVFHCFSGSLDLAQRAWEAGFFTSFTGIITYPKSEELRLIVKNAPLERIMVETDCPFLAPQKYRGQRNEPAYVLEVVEEIARVRGFAATDVAEKTYNNSVDFFPLF